MTTSSTTIHEKIQNLREEGKFLGREDTFTARIYVGTHDTENDTQRPVMEIKALCQEIVEEGGLCVNVHETFFQYGANGNGSNEHGAVVELIQYPRFPKSEDEIKTLSLEIAETLMEQMHQKRVSVICTDRTYTIQNPNHEEVDSQT